MTEQKKESPEYGVGKLPEHELSDFKKIIKNEDLNPEYFATQAEGLSKELRNVGSANSSYVFEKLEILGGIERALLPRETW